MKGKSRAEGITLTSSFQSMPLTQSSSIVAAAS